MCREGIRAADPFDFVSDPDPDLLHPFRIRLWVTVRTQIGSRRDQCHFDRDPDPDLHLCREPDPDNSRQLRSNPLIHGLFSDPDFKVFWERVSLFFFFFLFIRGIRNKKIQGQDFLGMGCLKIF